jgi:hypothetical protein
VTGKAMIKGITLHRPWAAAIAYFGKNVENRSWRNYLTKGSYLAIHAGAAWDDSGLESILRNGRLTPEIDFDDASLEQYRDLTKGHIIAIAQFDGNVKISDSPWFLGPIGWKLTNVVAIEPVRHAGGQGLWDIDPEKIDLVRENYWKALNWRA